MEVRLRKLGRAALVSICLAATSWAGLAARINAVVTQESQSKVQFSIHIVKADSGKTLYRHNANRALIPASNMKIISSAAALKYLGADYEFVTRVGLCGDGLVVIGSGDPLLGDKATEEKYGKERGWVFKDIAGALKEKAITRVRHIIVDSSIFDDERVHPSWPKEQLNRWYACEVSGLNYHDNCVDIGVATVAGRAVISVEPVTSFVKIVNKVTVIGSGKSTVGAYRNQEPNVIVVRGKCRGQVAAFSVAIERPAAFFGYLLAEELVRAGIELEGELIERAVDKQCELQVLRRYSHSLADCLARCNKNSLGLAAEALVKTIAAKATENGKNGGWEKGREVVSKYLRRLGIGAGEFYIDDASGLSRQNKLSANAITKVLLDIYRTKDWEVYKGSLAVGGVDGTIKRYFTEEKYKGKIIGKTGYISGVKAFSGVCSGGGGEYIFSILANGANGKTRGAINDIAKAIMDSE